MTADQRDSQQLRRVLGDGLRMRCATLHDAERLADFHAAIQVDPGQTTPNEGIRIWVLDLMSGQHPTFQPEDFLLVENEETGEIVSSMCLISQTWLYGGMPVKVGQPELVSTRADYRRRGLVRAQFDEIHRWSAERGEMVQAITGIPWYYRQFGYEMALPLGGNRTGFTPHVPRLPEGEEEPYTIRPAMLDDIPSISVLYETGSRRHRMSAVRDEAAWRHEIEGRTEKHLLRNIICIIESKDGRVAGFLAHKGELWGPGLMSSFYELKPGISWVQVTPSVVRYLANKGEEYAKRDAGKWEAFSFGLGSEHPAYEALSERMPRVRKPYAWYVRVPDIVAFLRHVAPALEAQLAVSPVAGHTGAVALNFYRGGARIKFIEGKIVKVSQWRNDSVEDGNASFPELTFLQLLFGRMSLEELETAFADCAVRSDEARALLTALFPKKPSNVWNIA